MINPRRSQALTGWYTPLQHDLIREITSFKFRTACIESRVTTDAEVRTVIVAVKNRHRRAAGLPELASDEEDEQDAVTRLEQSNFEDAIAHAENMLNEKASGSRKKGKKRGRRATFET